MALEEEHQLEKYFCKQCGGEWFLKWEDSKFEIDPDDNTLFYCPHCGKPQGWA